MQKRKRGFSLLELQIAFVVLGIGLVGLGPLVITQVKHLRQLDTQLSEKSTYYFVPSTDVWARKLGAAALMAPAAPGPASPPPQTGAVNDLGILSLNVSSTSDEITATVSLTPIPQ